MLNTVILGLAFGVAGLAVFPMLAKHTPVASSVGNAYVNFASWALQRPAIGVGKNGELSLRQLSFDAVYEQETISVDDVEKKITRTAKNVHRFGKTPFTFVDEEYGVTFDLRDVAFGEKEHRHRDDGEMVYTDMAFDDEGMPTRIAHYVRGVIEFGERPAVSMDLDESIRPIVDGSEKADWFDYMWEAVRRMYIDRQREVGVLKLSLPFIIFGVMFALGFYVLGPGNMPGSGASGGSSPITVGSLLLLSMPTSAEEISWKQAGGAVAALIGFGLVALVAVVAGPATLVIFGVTLGVGASIMPILTALTGAIGRGGSLGELIIWWGLSAFDDPVLDLTENGQYRFVEADELGLESVPTTMFCKTLVGFSPEVSPGAFGHAGLTSVELGNLLPANAMTDGGASVVPHEFATTSRISNAGHDSFVPRNDRIDDGATYVRTDHWLARFADAATGDAIDKAESEATKEFAAGDPQWSDGDLMKYSAVAGAVGIGFWVVIGVVL
ncbi:hypothetical protein Hbl1158_16930 (plasmid) [Halobaculum sp. CBA1158]|uniref:hypothetical protein n=1 Tax=Halobaculum sp. CBA1158 TaxID=2904243 RepID=UPI001F2FED44|nr:hypothetical protein [Halobaculum sp. CBA1158]UIP01739.1 hypothetical protein Hbl1158_16930 [Halobaculum sp. CBA1158]